MLVDESNKKRNFWKKFHTRRKQPPHHKSSPLGLFWTPRIFDDKTPTTTRITLPSWFSASASSFARVEFKLDSLDALNSHLFIKEVTNKSVLRVMINWGGLTKKLFFKLMWIHTSLVCFLDLPCYFVWKKGFLSHKPTSEIASLLQE